MTGNIKTVYTKRLCKLNDTGEYDGNDYLLGNSESDLEEMNGEQGVLVGTFFVDENGDWGLNHVHIEK